MTHHAPHTTHAPDTTEHRSLETPVGRLDVHAIDEAIVAIDWSGDDARPDTVSPGEHPLLDRAIEQLGEYFDGRRTDFDLPLAPTGTEFQRSAWEVLTRIPFGETITYGEQARRLGDANKSRAVGAANGRNPIPIVVPCHRVVGATGKLTGFAGGLDTKAWLLDHELHVRATDATAGG